jgi:hypothetical protein
MRFPFLRSASALAALALFAHLPAANAQVTLYTDRASFNAAAPALTTIDFTGQAPTNDFTDYFPSSMVTLAGVTFQSGGDLFTIDQGFDANYNYGSGVVLSAQGAGGPDLLTILLPANVTAFGLDFADFNGPSPHTFTLSTGDVFVRNGGSPPLVGGSGFAFVGFTSVIPLTSVLISVNGFRNAADNVSFGPTSPQQAAIPEPGTLALLAPGLLPLVGMIRRRRRA